MALIAGTDVRFNVGDSVVLFGLQSAQFNGAQAEVLGPVAEGRHRVRIIRATEKKADDVPAANIKLANMHLVKLAVPSVAAATGKVLKDALDVYRLAKPWEDLYMRHVVMFSYGKYRGYALTMGSTDPSRKCAPALNIATSFADVERMFSPQGNAPSTNVFKVTFRISDGHPDEILIWGTDGFLHPIPIDDDAQLSSALGQSGLALLTAGARALASFSNAKQSNSLRSKPTVLSSGEDDYLPCMGCVDQGTVAPPVVYRYLHHGDDTVSTCEGCGKVAKLQHPCQKCHRAVRFCSPKCLGSGHDEYMCSKYREMMSCRDDKVGFGALGVVAETTSACVSLCGLLRCQGLHGKNWWARQCMCEVGGDSCQLPDLSKLSTAEAGLAPLEADMVPHAHLAEKFGPANGFVRDWVSWALFRGVSLSSPAPLVLHSALTVYHAIQLALPEVLVAATGEPRTLVVHVVGVEREVFELGTFSEVAALLPPHVGLEIDLVGPGVPASRDNEIMDFSWAPPAGSSNGGAVFPHSKGRLLRCKEYSVFASSDSRFRRPDLVVGLNAGLSAGNPDYFEGTPQPWFPALQMIIEMRLPAVFTDYYRVSAQMPLSQWGSFLRAQGATVLAPTLNPFRQPLAKEINERYAFYKAGFNPSFNNGIIFGWKY